ncbi:MAG TPA: glycosyltransferase family 39 protein [Thermoanaerobaculia bacterium]|nr:glycosyltransferase family 39 protein [Thermoanaerobaculia bacterium]
MTSLAPSTPSPSMAVAAPDTRGLSRLGTGPAIVAWIAALKFTLHFATASLYGFFIDEIYFLACGQHLAWGYADMPPLTAFQAWLTRLLFGDSPWSIRLFPSLAGAGLVLLTGAIVRQLGGGRFAQALAALAVLVAPLNLAVCSYLSMNSIEPLAWMGCAFVMIKILKSGDTRLWIWFGAIAGIGLLNKHTMLVFGFSLVVGLLLTAGRRLMFNRWFLIAGAIAFLIFLPNLAWEIQHHFPHLELLANIRRNGRDISANPFWFLVWNVILMNPAAAPLWIAGLVSLLAGSLKRFRALGLAYVIAYVVLIASNGRVYYLGPAYSMLFAAGAIATERLLASDKTRWTRVAYAAIIVVVGAAIAPTVVPLLPPDLYLRYTEITHIRQPKFENRGTMAMPQFFADRFGWPEMVATVAKVYNSLPPDERARTAIFGNDFGQSGAIDYYGPRYGLPRSIGGHLSNWYWGPRNYTGESILVLGDRRDVLESKFEDVKAVAEIGHPCAMRQEHFTLFLCHKPRGWTLASAWPKLKNWN